MKTLFSSKYEYIIASKICADVFYKTKFIYIYEYITATKICADVFTKLCTQPAVGSELGKNGNHIYLPIPDKFSRATR